MTFFDKSSLIAFDQALIQIEQGAQTNDDLVVNLAQYSIPLIGDPSRAQSLDPLSPEYARFVQELHREIIGKEHSSSMEGLPEINFTYERDWPYPWGTKAPQTVARFLIAYGFLLQVANLPQHARILEVGCGTGSLTWNLARMGYRVDALDPNEKQCAVVRNFTRDFPIPPNVVAMTLDQWLDAKSNLYKYDAVIFFESFHHVFDHQECVRRISLDHLEQDGAIFLAAEPIHADQNTQLPYPWGPRLDGESLRAMRRWGWLELGFTRSYIDRLFAVFGMAVAHRSCDAALPHSAVSIATFEPQKKQSCGSAKRYPAMISDGIFFANEHLPSFLASIEGLDSPESWGRWSIGKRVVLKFSEELPSSFHLTIDLAEVFGPNVGKKLEVIAGGQRSTCLLAAIEVKRSYSFDFSGVTGDTLEFDIPQPFRPKSIPELANEDPRKLGLAFKALRISVD